jgi:hypothetical protein
MLEPNLINRFNPLQYRKFVSQECKLYIAGYAVIQARINAHDRFRIIFRPRNVQCCALEYTADYSSLLL